MSENNWVQIWNPGGVFLGILGGAHGSPNPDPISDQKIFIFHTRLQIWHRQKLCYHYLDLNAN